MLVSCPNEDASGEAWASGVAREWSDELGDSRQDIYSLDDGQPVNAPRLISGPEAREI